MQQLSREQRVTKCPLRRTILTCVCSKTQQKRINIISAHLYFRMTEMLHVDKIDTTVLYDKTCVSTQSVGGAMDSHHWEMCLSLIVHISSYARHFRWRNTTVTCSWETKCWDNSEKIFRELWWPIYRMKVNACCWQQVLV